jgi:hypothetical protein
MLIDNFNKFGDTSFRVSDQLKYYRLLILKLGDLDEEELNKFDDEEFRDWCKEEGIYNYSDKNFNRYKFVISFLKKIGLLKYNDEKIDRVFLKKICEDISTKPEATFFNAIIKNATLDKTNKAFKEMCSFILKSEISEFNLETLSLCFFCYDGETTFKELYEKGLNINHFVDKYKETKNYEKCISVIKQNDTNNLTLPLFRKSITGQRVVIDILNRRMNNIDIDSAIFNSQEEKIYKIIAERFGFSMKGKNRAELVKFINSKTFDFLMNEFVKWKFQKLLLKDYKDLFFRWLHEFKFINSSSTTETKLFKEQFTNVVDDELNYKSTTLLELEYPYSKEESIEIIKKIDSTGVNDKNVWQEIRDQYEGLRLVPNPAIAEYFINLYFSYLLNIEPKNFVKFSRTKVDNLLNPVFTAPGGGSDFEYFDDKTGLIVSIETSIISNVSQMKEKEIFQSTKHLMNLIRNWATEENDIVQFLVGYNNIVKEDSLKETYELIVGHEVRGHSNQVKNRVISFTECAEIDSI